MNDSPQLPAVLQQIRDSFPLRLQAFATAQEDPQLLEHCHQLLQPALASLIDELLAQLRTLPGAAQRLQQADTHRLHQTLCNHALELFTPQPDAGYASRRLQVGLLHKQHGVEPALFLAASQQLQSLLERQLCPDPATPTAGAIRSLLGRRLMLDASLVIDAYLHSLLAEVEQGREQLERYAQEMATLSRTDALTGLLNTRDLRDEFSHMLASAARHHEPVTAIYLDINDFKQINDQHGHERGDQVLKAVGAAILAVTRSSDRCFRCGGDEFCLLLDNCSASAARDQLIPRLNEQLACEEPEVSISFGVVQSGPEVHHDGRTLLRLADQRMYKAKRHYKQQRLAGQTQSRLSNSSSCGGPR